MPKQNDDKLHITCRVEKSAMRLIDRYAREQRRTRSGMLRAIILKSADEIAVMLKEAKQ